MCLKACPRRLYQTIAIVRLVFDCQDNRNRRNIGTTEERVVGTNMRHRAIVRGAGINICSVVHTVPGGIQIDGISLANSGRGGGILNRDRCLAGIQS